MAKEKKTRDYLPTEEPTVTVQAEIPRSKHEAVNKQRSIDKATWDKLINACLDKYLAESPET